ncbi:MAG: right-handed parallel beta-helix repeat-containing protein, partial [Planctomycetota bacterium]
TLTAHPNSSEGCGYRVIWADTDNDASMALTNTVTMTRDRNVTVEFEMVPEHQISVSVVGGNGKFSVDDDPTLLDVFDANYCEGSITLTSHADQGYHVAGWYDASGQLLSFQSTVDVVLDSNQTITVEFRVPQTLTVPGGELETIDQAINAAGSGDLIIVYGGGGTYTYTPQSSAGYDFQGKSIFLRSFSDSDPAIIDCGKDGRAFHFHSGEGPETKIANVVIRNGYAHGPAGTSGYEGGMFPSDPNDPNSDPDPNAGPGGDAFGDSYGGAIYCTNGSSPTFENCTITNCMVSGAIGGHGGEGLSGEGAGQGGWGGDGIGTGHGGAIACTANSNPTFVNCTITGNRAVGGVAGMGGPGGYSFEDDSIGPPGYRGSGYGDGVGGGIYARNSEPKFVDCTISDNIASDSDDILRTFDADFFNSYISWVEYYSYYWADGTGYGAGAYFDTAATADFNNCDFKNNRIHGKKVDYGWDWWDPNSYDPNILYDPYDPYYPYIYWRQIYYGDGAGLCTVSNNTAVLKDCSFAGNRIGNEDIGRGRYSSYSYYYGPIGQGNGGGLYCGGNCQVTLENCSFSENSNGIKDYGSVRYYYYSYYDRYMVRGDGGGVYCGAGSNVTLDGCWASWNESTYSGGGFFFGTGCSVDMNDCIAVGNDANDSGGGLYCSADSVIAIDNSIFASNKAVSAAGGGLCIADTDVDITNCSITDNTAKRGAGLFWTDGEVAVVGCTIAGNSAIGEYEAGGGLHCMGSSPTIENCVITENATPYGFGAGGYIAGTGQRPLLKNCLVTKNLAGHDGGGIYVDLGCVPKISNCTFADNSASSYGGGLYVINDSHTTIIDSILWGNTADIDPAQIWQGDVSSSVDATHCDIE